VIELEDVSGLEGALEVALEVALEELVGEDGKVEARRERDRARCANSFIHERQSAGCGPPATVPW